MFCSYYDSFVWSSNAGKIKMYKCTIKYQNYSFKDISTHEYIFLVQTFKHIDFQKKLAVCKYTLQDT